jgi:hypothetical protein
MHCTEMFGDSVRCEGCNEENPDGALYVKVEGSVDMYCFRCIIQQVRASATRDTLMRIVGCVYHDFRKKK